MRLPHIDLAPHKVICHDAQRYWKFCAVSHYRIQWSGCCTATLCLFTVVHGPWPSRWRPHFSHLFEKQYEHFLSYYFPNTCTWCYRNVHYTLIERHHYRIHSCLSYCWCSDHVCEGTLLFIDGIFCLSYGSLVFTYLTLSKRYPVISPTLWSLFAYTMEAFHPH